ncbi:glycosyltransferase [Deinococcus koreensis]|uniref:Glycosyl transferase n=1 Tax=Deinococcus koreensis TaxID=2054903 RepID=A0A2K3UTF1_9DEIO|nr:glycosyltransferase [Deinococcus koreensis]PNY79780.1 glycosyl transferase [Deinococcus koreensis]
MHILHLNTSDSAGGAARGAYWLHRALATRANSQMLVQHKSTQDDSVRVHRSSRLDGVARRTDRALLRPYPAAPTDFSLAALPRTVHREVNQLNPDIVNLHWINGGFMTPENIRQIRAPVVWTLRDLWPMTGGCHYARGCEGFTVECGHCPQLRSTREHDPSRWLWTRKRRAWRDTELTLVALSGWLAREAKRSSLLGGYETLVIPNALDTDTFQPQQRAQVQATLGLPQDRRYILFSAMNPLEDKRKGFAQLKAALGLLAARPDAEHIELLVAGALYSELPSLPIKARFLGLISDDLTMSRLYSAATVTVMPSIEEAFGKVAMESLACGTPVVCLRDTGTAEIVQHLQHGYHAAPLDIADLAAGLEYVLDHSHPEAMATAVREHVMNTYTYGHQADSYLKLYEHLIDRRRSRTHDHARRSAVETQDIRE